MDTMKDSVKIIGYYWGNYSECKTERRHEKSERKLRDLEGRISSVWTEAKITVIKWWRGFFKRLFEFSSREKQKKIEWRKKMETTTGILM